jgi:hypothetical protein
MDSEPSHALLRYRGGFGPRFNGGRDVAFNDLIQGLKRTEQQLVKQLEGIRGAIASLELGNAVSPAMKVRRQRRQTVRKRRRLSAKGRAAISRAQKARWAKQKAHGKK